MRRLWKGNGQLRRTLLVPLALIGAALLLTGCLENTSPTTVSTTSQPEGIAVTGLGKIKVVPDVVVLRLGIEVAAPTVGEAYSEASDTMDKVLAALRSAGLEDKDLQTVNFSIYPIYAQNRSLDGTQEVTGYRVANFVNARVSPIDRVEQVLIDMTAAGGDAARVQNVQLQVDDPDALDSQLRELALEDAKAKADQIAQLTGVTLGEVTYVQEGSVPSPISPSFGVFAAEAKSSSSISAGETELSLQLSVVYSLAK